MKLFSISLD